MRVPNAARAQDPEFCRFQRTLQSYYKILNERTTLVLSASSALLKLLTEGIPDPETVNPPTPEKPPTKPTPDPSKRVSQADDPRDEEVGTGGSP